MIWDIPLCYSKLALPPTHSVSAKNFGLGLSVIEASKSGSKENYIHPPCSPLCVLLAVLPGHGAEKSGIQELHKSSRAQMYTQTCRDISGSTVPAQAVANSTEPVLWFQSIIISSSWPQCYSSQPFAK